MQNTAGTVTAQSAIIGTNSTIADSGTLAGTTDTNISSTNAQIRLTCNSSLTTPTVSAKFAVMNLSDLALTFAW